MTSFIHKYSPKTLDHFICDDDFKQTILDFIDIDHLNLLFVGNNGVGKSSLINCIVSNYYNEDIHCYSKNIYRLNNLKEQTISSLRIEMKTFLQAPCSIRNKKKIVILDDIDTINEQMQHVLRNSMDMYSSKTHFICSCTNINKVLDTIQSQLFILKLKTPTERNLYTLINYIMDKENILLDDTMKQYLIRATNHSYRSLINYMEKIYLLDTEIITLDVLRCICNLAKDVDFDRYLSVLIQGEIRQAYNILLNIYNDGYTVVDILDHLFHYLSSSKILNDDLRYNLLPYISQYITVFHTLHEEEIELFFFTYEIYVNVLCKNI